jgi:hypothetical protein
VRRREFETDVLGGGRERRRFDALESRLFGNSSLDALEFVGASHQGRVGS